MKISSTEKKVLIYAALFIGISLNMHRFINLIAPEQSYIGTPWKFNLPELLYQIIYHILFCYFIGFLNLKLIYKDLYFKTKINWPKLLLIDSLLFLFFLAIGSFSQRIIFDNIINLKLYRGGYFARFSISLGLVAILIKILFLYKRQRLKDIENEKLKAAYYTAELNNLRAQVNPHFLFNALTNLSALIREKPTKAQEYVAHLSKVFRYSLSNNTEQIVNLSKEMELLYSNIELLKMRFEDSLILYIDKEMNQNLKIPHMSLQPLLENALKHNYVAPENPLTINIYIQNEELIFKNTICEPKFKEPSTGIGLLNLNDRYKMLAGKEINIQKTQDFFIVKLPLV